MKKITTMSVLLCLAAMLISACNHSKTAYDDPEVAARAQYFNNRVDSLSLLFPRPVDENLRCDSIKYYAESNTLKYSYILLGYEDYFPENIREDVKTQLFCTLYNVAGDIDFSLYQPTLRFNMYSLSNNFLGGITVEYDEYKERLVSIPTINAADLLY